METLELNKLLLKTAFCCMACDGDIDKREIKIINKLQKEKKIFGEIDIKTELNTFLKLINKDSKGFLDNYFVELVTLGLTTSDELKLVEVAITIIKADENIEYSEIKFFKVIYSKLKIENECILEKHPDFEEYLEKDIIIDNTYLLKFQQNFLEDCKEIFKENLYK